MNDIETGGPAFPTESAGQTGSMTWRYEGMTLRDHFAGEALKGILYMVAHGVHTAANSPEGCAAESFKLADAMLAARAAK